MNIAVIIATSHKRFDTLIHRAIHSVITQNLKENLTIVVVDDNEKDCTHILQQYTDSINPAIPIQIIRNTRTKHHSGTGSWNSGAMYVLQKFLAHSQNNKYSTQYITDSKDYAKILFNTSSLPHYYLAFLDDDDSWEKEYLQEVFNTIQDSIQQNNGKNKVALVAAGISFITQNNNKLLLPTEELLTKEKILSKPKFHRKKKIPSRRCREKKTKERHEGERASSSLRTVGPAPPAAFGARRDGCSSRQLRSHSSRDVGPPPMRLYGTKGDAHLKKCATQKTPVQDIRPLERRPTRRGRFWSRCRPEKATV